MAQSNTTNLELTTVEARDTLPEAVTKDNFEILDSYVAATKLTNFSGGSVIAGTVVVPHTLNNCFTTTTTANNPKVIGVVQETIANVGSGIVKHYGTTLVRVTATTSVGDWLTASSTAGVAAPVTSTNPPNGAFAIALEARVGAGTVTALLVAASVQGALSAPASTSPTPTSDGAIEWDSNDNYQVWGDGAGQKYFFPDNKGSAITAASTITVGSDAVYEVNGTTTITGATSNPAGQRVFLIFNAATPLTHSSSFFLANEASRITVPNEVVQFLSLGSGNWREISANTGKPAVATANQTVNNTTTFTSSTYLRKEVAANSTYHVKAILEYQSNTTPDFKAGFLGPTGITGALIGMGHFVSGDKVLTDRGDLSTPNSTFAVNGLSGGTTSDLLLIEGIIHVGSTAGTLILQFAQNTQNASNTVLIAGSQFTLTKVA